MKVTPFDLRQTQFATTFAVTTRTRSAPFLDDAAEDYEQALRDIDRLRQELSRAEEDLTEHRDREVEPAEHAAHRAAARRPNQGERRERGANDACVRRRDAPIWRSQKSQARLEEIEREITELKLRRRDVESTLESSVAAVQNALEHVRSKAREEKDEKLLLHRPRQGGAASSGTSHGGADAVSAPRPAAGAADA